MSGSSKSVAANLTFTQAAKNSRPRSYQSDRICRSHTYPRALYEDAKRLAARGEVYTPTLPQMLDRGLELAVAEQKGEIRIEKVGNQ